ncbi:DUF262 domain-containing protein [Sphingosinithalassobacter sp. LHW66-3]|uniref:DUF262 domain-containing protein n=1 Tax=Sphingosinithalassobacter sp. LHW66-3 TaxID=3424718 RepID=UPI003D6A885B
MALAPVLSRGDMLCQRATAHTLAALFGGITVFKVPAFQRVYSWDAEAVDAFLADIERCYLKRRDDEPERHFFGSIVTGPASSGNSVQPHRQVLDGQQRLATFALFMSTLVHEYRKLAEDFPADAAIRQALKSRANFIWSQYIMAEDVQLMEIKETFSISLNQADDAFFKSLLRGETPDVHSESHERLQDAHKRISDFLANKRDAAADKPEVLNGFYRLLVSDLEIVHIEAGDPRHASQIFRVLNNRGIPVSICDLLRASTMELCEGKLQDAEFAELRDAWLAIASIEQPSPDDALQMAQKARLPGSDPVAQTSAKFEVGFFPQLEGMEQLTPDDARELLQSVRERRDDIRAIEALSKGDVHTALETEFSAVERCLAQSLLGEQKQGWILPLLYNARLANQQVRSRILLDLVLFGFRYGVVVRAPIAPFEKAMRMPQVILLEEPGNFNIGDLETRLRDLLLQHANDEAFANGLKELDYGRNKKAIRFLLAVAEFTREWFDAGAQGRPQYLTPDQAIDLSKITIEHIGPQNPADADPLLRPLVHRLGNLTLLAGKANDDAANKEFAEKKAIFAASNLRLNQDLVAHDEWTPELATARQEALIGQAMRVFSLDHHQQGPG